MDDFIARLDLRGALEFYLFLEQQENALQGSTLMLFCALRSYLYERLSIEDMESPRTLLEKLC